jgi:hypothetical protein
MHERVRRTKYTSLRSGAFPCASLRAALRLSLRIPRWRIEQRRTTMWLRCGGGKEQPTAEIPRTVVGHVFMIIHGDKVDLFPPQNTHGVAQRVADPHRVHVTVQHTRPRRKEPAHVPRTHRGKGIEL